MNPQSNSNVSDAAGPWAPYTPNAQAPWNLRRVVHLHRRAGFAASWSEIQRDLKDGPTASIERLLAGKANAYAPPDFADIADLLADWVEQREREVLELIGRGLSNKEIGRELCLSVATVKHHVHHVLEKLGLSGRAEAMRRVRDDPWIARISSLAYKR